VSLNQSPLNSPLVHQPLSLELYIQTYQMELWQPSPKLLGIPLVVAGWYQRLNWRHSSPSWLDQLQRLNTGLSASEAERPGLRSLVNPSHWGKILRKPISLLSAHQALKISNNGAYINYGGNYQNISVGWQYSWIGWPK
jgi:hypothetical protein